GKVGKSGFQVASEMTWDISGEYKSWESFPVQQKWFATGEAISHLRYLEEEGLVTREIRGGKILYGL
ncbi:MAG: MBL fold metallo-hydrolase, partial [Desulfobacterales bacterium]|nr:MBL fold metallo-hydrolase [Desulfobacterales bacterium]